MKYWMLKRIYHILQMCRDGRCQCKNPLKQCMDQKLEGTFCDGDEECGGGGFCRLIW